VPTTPTAAERQDPHGLLLGTAAFGMWGLFPLYWPLLEPTSAIEILAHRIVWSLVVSVGLLIATRRGSRLRGIWTNRRARIAMTVAGVVICFNWGTYIWGVNNGHVVETSLGYYINPLVTVLMGVAFLKERLRPWQWTALAIAFVAVLVLSLQVGRPPWIALILASSFGTYGLVKKKAAVGPVEGLTWEGMVSAPVALGFIVWVTVAGDASAWSHGQGHVALLMLTGIVTAAPLLCFAAAANRISLTTLGLLQYIAPTLQLAIGVLWFDEPMGALRWIGFSLVWIALAIFTVESIVVSRSRPAVQVPEAVEAGAVLDEACLENLPAGRENATARART
jgi:chloramphenicol-sensitive protein RarD